METIAKNNHYITKHGIEVIENEDEIILTYSIDAHSQICKYFSSKEEVFSEYKINSMDQLSSLVLML